MIRYSVFIRGRLDQYPLKQNLLGLFIYVQEVFDSARMKNPHLRVVTMAAIKACCERYAVSPCTNAGYLGLAWSNVALCLARSWVAWYWEMFHRTPSETWQIYKTVISENWKHYLWDVITWSCPWHLLQAYWSSILLTLRAVFRFIMADCRMISVLSLHVLSCINFNPRKDQ